MNKQVEITESATIGHNNPPSDIDQLVAYLEGNGELTPILTQIKTNHTGEIDLTTAKGRDAIASRAYAVSKIKTSAEKHGKELVADWKAKSKVVDTKRAELKTKLDELRDQIRKPLTDWEAEQEAKKAAIQEKLAGIDDLRSNAGTTPAEISAALASVETVVVDDSWDELKSLGEAKKSGAVEFLTAALADAKQREADQAELTKLRAIAAEREQRDREIAEAAEAKRKKEESDRAEKERLAKVEADRLQAIADATAKAQRDAEAAAERERQEAQKREEALKQEIADAAKREAEAVEAERRRVAEAQRVEREAKEKREANEKHRAKVHATLSKALAKITNDEGLSAQIATAIFKGEIPHLELKL